ncbi:MAG: cell wall hydrolase [Phenylobacterium sp.]|uniref:cell wall hydrolase n=1 Tax=Phenylobacterium sp. TaxID=1871053 RepID=UPI00273560E0|nr:cell wall hydrolase [Phenylobacterium sp.]MDP1641101.1 cell wall hydrolase [Phenylobacterium sp.]MDP3118287.1 cell wall hydrolase [Phenylobacterium sp.]
MTAFARSLALLFASLALAGCLTTYDRPINAGRAEGMATVARSLSDRGLERLTADMDQAMLALARRHDPAPRKDYWGRVPGWETYDLATLPTLGFGTAFDMAAREINAFKPFADLPINPMEPFILRASRQDQAQALRCLSQAIYYEAAREPREGQRAVAQVVLNRVRHPAYPNSVCGVVFQGSARSTGCQFSFTCDGSLTWAPEPGLWRQVESVAREALEGFVETGVGSATHYHADYVAPYWAPTLVKMTKVGAHIFYRWTGPMGEPPAFTSRYVGGEENLSVAILGGVDARTQGLFNTGQALAPGRKVTLALAGEVRTYEVAEPGSGEAATRVAGVLQPSRRQPTPDEIREINERLAEVEAELDAPGSAVAPAPKAP